MTEERHLPEDLQREAASLIHLIEGVGSKHLIVVGGLLPPLLAPEAEALHAGSRDIDFCFSVALTEGHTREYYRSIEELIAPYFEPLNPGSTFRWIKKSTAPGLPIVVDFLAPEDPEDPLAKAEGVRDLSDQTAADNTGTRLRPFRSERARSSIVMSRSWWSTSSSYTAPESAPRCSYGTRGRPASSSPRPTPSMVARTPRTDTTSPDGV
jgi:hypothetical protein